MRALTIAAMACAALATPVAAAVTAQVAAPSASSALHGEKALQLARLLNSEDNIIGSDADDEKVLALVPQLFAGRKEIADLEARYPNVSIEMVRAAMPTMNRSARARLPELWRRQAALYSETLTTDELTLLTDFYASATGQKMIAALYKHAKPDAMIAEARESKDFKASGTSAMRDIRAATPSVVSELNDSDKAYVALVFSRPGLAEKMRVAAPKTQSVVLDWMNESQPGEDAEVEAVMVAVVKRRQEAGK